MWFLCTSQQASCMLHSLHRLLFWKFTVTFHELLARARRSLSREGLSLSLPSTQQHLHTKLNSLFGRFVEPLDVTEARGGKNCWKCDCRCPPDVSVATETRKMEFVANNAKKKLLLRALLWWSLILELVSGGNSSYFFFFLSFFLFY